jgi:benzil reductase ((S)-benzoin forming)
MNAARRLYVLTGASRGLGAALAEQLLAPDVHLLTLSRQPDESLTTRARASGALLEQWAIDVGHDVGASARLEAWLHGYDPARFAAVALINNAGRLGHVGPIDRAPAEDIAAVLRVDLEAPMLLTAAFLRATRTWPIDRRVLSISSGAGKRPVAGWAAYCAAKAGLDHFSRVVALDEAMLPNPARIVSLAPGIIDTEMQAELRAADGAGFPEQAHFVEFKATGQLSTPQAAAARVLTYLHRADFGSDPVADVRQT